MSAERTVPCAVTSRDDGHICPYTQCSDPAFSERSCEVPNFAQIVGCGETGIMIEVGHGDHLLPGMAPESAAQLGAALADLAAAAGARPAERQAVDTAPGSGPFETEQQARETPAARAWREAFDRDPGAGKGHAPNLASLTAALDDAGVTLGEFDRRIVSWLAGWEPTTVAVIAGLIRRASAPAPRGDPGGAYVTPADLATVVDALRNTVKLERQQAADCSECDASPADLCDTCEFRLAMADGYDALAARLGGAR